MHLLPSFNTMNDAPDSHGSHMHISALFLDTSYTVWDTLKVTSVLLRSSNPKKQHLLDILFWGEKAMTEV